MTYITSTASKAVDFVSSIGVNTHIDFTSTTYNNLGLIESSINYLGVKNLRDSAENPADTGANGWWQQVANATGAKFDAYLPEGSITAMQNALGYAVTLAHQGILNFIEGGDEEDSSWAISQGNSLAYTAQYQQTVASTAHSLGLKAINMSFGQGWSNPTGNYGTVGNLAAYADFANAHTYPINGNPPLGTITMINGDAQLAAVGQPVITTEFGYDTTGSTTDSTSVSQTVQAKYLLDGLFDAFAAGDVKTYLYELFDQSSGSSPQNNFGLFTASGAAKPAAIAIHNATTLLADSGGSFAPGSLSYSLSGTLSTDHSLLLQKSDGSFWLALWNEVRLSGPTSPADISVPNHMVTLSLANSADVTVFDPLTGTSSVQSANGASSLQISLPDHPILVEIQSTTSSTSTSANAPPPVVPPAATPSDLAILLPAAETVAAGSVTTVTGVSISDPWAASAAGTMSLNLSVAAGSLDIGNGSAAVSGQSIHLSGTLSQLNADLATMHYHAPSNGGADQISVNVWNQAGVSVTQALAISAGTAVALAPTDLAIVLPAGPNVAAGTAASIAGVSISDAWAASAAGAMALNLSVGSGSLDISNGSSTVSGQAIHLSGSLSQLNADLATLHYHAVSVVGVDHLSVNVWNQAGVSVTQALGISVG